MNVFEIVDEWRRGCTVSKFDHKGPPEKCEECTAAAMRAVARWVDEQRQKAERHDAAADDALGRLFSDGY